MAVFLLMVAALYNGYPIVDAGTTAFVEQAAYPHFTPDCTPFYGIFIKVTSLGWSLWFPVMVQALLLSALLIRYIYVLFDRGDRQPRFGTMLSIMVVVVSLTGVSWVVSQLMADVFAPILLLSILLLYYDEKAKRLVLLLYSASALLAIAMHFSHFADALGCGILFGVLAWRAKDGIKLRRSMWLLAACGAFWLVMCGANAAKHHGFVFARGKNVFLVSRLAEMGVLNAFLNDKCPGGGYRMCEAGQKIPTSQAEFLGSGESPFYRYGGWDSGTVEYSRVLKGVFSSPIYVAMFARKAVVSALQQMVFVVPPSEFPAYGKESEPYKKVKSYYSDESREYATSQQQQGLLSASVFSTVYLLILVLTTLWVYLLPRSDEKAMWRGIYGIILAFFVVNAMTVGVFGSVSPRFQYRIAWVLPLTNILSLFSYYRNSEVRIIIKAKEVS